MFIPWKSYVLCEFLVTDHGFESMVLIVSMIQAVNMAMGLVPPTSSRNTLESMGLVGRSGFLGHVVWMKVSSGFRKGEECW